MPMALAVISVVAVTAAVFAIWPVVTTPPWQDASQVSDQGNDTSADDVAEETRWYYLYEQDASTITKEYGTVMPDCSLCIELWQGGSCSCKRAADYRDL